MFLDQVAAQLAQRPATIGQPDHRRRLIRQSHHFGNLSGSDLGRRTRRPQPLHGADPRLFKRVQVRVDRVGMHALRLGDRQRVQPHTVEDQGFSAALLLPVGQASDALSQLSNFEGRRSANSQWTSHGIASLSEACHSNND